MKKNNNNKGKKKKKKNIKIKNIIKEKKN